MIIKTLLSKSKTKSEKGIYKSEKGLGSKNSGQIQPRDSGITLRAARQKRFGGLPHNRLKTLEVRDPISPLVSHHGYSFWGLFKEAGENLEDEII